uniref:Guanylate cyclase domain-containing protein n=1 Tax=Plectus sambesii TaxID=2011161 RepID=A0A914XMQ4_9BILA
MAGPLSETQSVHSQTIMVTNNRVGSATSRQSGRSGRSNRSRASSLAKSLLGMASDDQLHARLVAGLKLLGITIPPVAAVVFLSVLMVVQLQKDLSETSSLQAFLSESQRIQELVGALQRERGMTCVLLESSRATSATSVERSEIAGNLSQLRGETTEIIFSIPDWGQISSIGGAFESQRTFFQSLAEHRAKVGVSVNDCFENIKYYSSSIDTFIKYSEQMFYGSSSGKYWGKLEALRMMIHANDLVGIKRALGGSFFAATFFTPEMNQHYTEVSGAVIRLLDLASSSDADVAQYLLSVAQSPEGQMAISSMEAMEIEIRNNRTTGLNSSLNWFNNVTVYMNTVIQPTTRFTDGKISEETKSKRDSKIQTFIITIAIMSIVLVLSVTVTIWFGVDSHRLNNKIKEKASELAVEKSKTDQLLNQVLPRSIVRELKVKGVVAPQTFSAVTVFFSDIKGFTQLSAKSSPMQIINLLNELYSAMDTTLDRYSCYKVETIGDAYMVVSGAPKPNGTVHSTEICTMALDVLQEIGNLKIPHMPEERLMMRIGIHTGPVAAGVVGLKMPRYCLFGDTVNTASRMESTGEPMCIHLSDSTKHHLEVHHSHENYTVEPRGERLIKGKGVMMTHWLLGKDNFPFYINLEASRLIYEQTHYWRDLNDYTFSSANDNDPDATDFFT